MDRFNFREDIEFHPEGISEGVKARLMGFPIDSQNPYEKKSWMWKSFRAGWVEADMDEMAPKEPIQHGNTVTR